MHPLQKLRGSDRVCLAFGRTPDLPKPLRHLQGCRALWTLWQQGFRRGVSKEGQGQEPVYRVSGA